MNRCLTLCFSLVAFALSSNLRAQEAVPNAVKAHAQDFVILKEGKMLPFAPPEEFYQAPYSVIYFGGGWCPDCRNFSPALVKAYNRQEFTDKRFEVILFPKDKTAAGMLEYMKSEKMKWPALAFDKVATAKDLQRYYAGKGIPCVTVIDPAGNIVLQSKSDKDAADILKELKALVKKR